MKQNKFIIGLTGGSGAGKGEVAKILSKLGADIICADAVAHGIMKKDASPAFELIVAAFGKSVIGSDGEICRKALREIVFYDKSKLTRLTSLLNPIITDAILNTSSESKAKFVVIDAPLLIPSGLNAHCDVVIGVFAPKKLRIERICKRDGLSEAEALARLDNQMSDNELRPCVDFEINNEYTFEELSEIVGEVFADIADYQK